MKENCIYVYVIVPNISVRIKKYIFFINKLEKSVVLLFLLLTFYLLAGLLSLTRSERRSDKMKCWARCCFMFYILYQCIWTFIICCIPLRGVAFTASCVLVFIVCWQLWAWGAKFRLWSVAKWIFQGFFSAFGWGLSNKFGFIFNSFNTVWLSFILFSSFSPLLLVPWVKVTTFSHSGEGLFSLATLTCC